MKTNAFYTLHPRSIAVVGVSGKGAQGGKTGASLLFSNLLEFGYPGKLFPVNPKSETIAGLKCYKSIKDIGEPIDMAVIGIPAKNVPDVLREAGAAGVKSAIIVTAGFAEIEGGQALQQELVDICSKFEIRMVGPNCLGIGNIYENIIASTSSGFNVVVSPGHLGLVSQSGAMTSSLIPAAVDKEIGFSYTISSGNEADMTLADYLELLLDDPNTCVVAAYIEELKDLSRLAELSQRAIQLNKPFIVYKPGKSKRAEASLAAHTGSLAGSDKIADAFFKQHGIIRAEEVEELYESGYLLTKGKQMRGNHIAVVTISGGAGSILCDICDEEGMEVPEVSAGTQEMLKTLLSPFASPANPVDVTGAIFNDPENFLKIFRVLHEDSYIDAIMWVAQQLPHYYAKIFVRQMVEFEQESSKPFAACWFTGEFNKEEIHDLRAGEVPVFRSFRPAIKAFKRVYQWSQMVSRKQTKQKAAEIVPRSLADYIEFSTGRSILNEFEGKTLFSKFGLPAAQGRVVTSPDAAAAAAAEVGYPVVLKAVSAEIAHKSDMGGVQLNLKTPEEVKNAYTEIESAVDGIGKQFDGVLVEQMISGGVEVITGITTDDKFGPTIVFGSGGIYTEVYKDAALRVCPIDLDDAMEMIQETKVYQILKGVRSKSPYDIEELAATLVKLSEFALDFLAEVKEVDINPLIVREKGQGVVVADALVVLKG